MTASLSVKQVVKRYDKRPILNGISFDAKEGEFIVLVGPSGCGKSTMLRSIAGLEMVSEGEIRIGNRDVTKLMPKDRNIAMVFQDYALYPHKNVYENIAFGLRIRSMPDAEIDRRVREAAAKLDLVPYLERKPSALSGGQRQRVAIGRAIVRQPDVFLFDEPLSNLDAKLRGSMRISISKLHKELNATIVYVTHDQVEAMTLADKIIVLDGGKIQQMGSPLDLYYHPKNKFVAEFIGSPPMNMIKGKLSLKDGALHFVSDRGWSFKMSETHLVKLNEKARGGQAVYWGVRAENLKPLTASDASPHFQAKVLVIEPLGPQSNVICDIQGDELSITMPEPHRPKLGDMITLTWQSKHIYMFDADTGLSLERETVSRNY